MTPTLEPIVGKVVMSAISEDVKWRKDRKEIVRYADETMAFKQAKELRKVSV